MFKATRFGGEPGWDFKAHRSIQYRHHWIKHDANVKPKPKTAVIVQTTAMLPSTKRYCCDAHEAGYVISEQIAQTFRIKWACNATVKRYSKWVVYNLRLQGKTIADFIGVDYPVEGCYAGCTVQGKKQPLQMQGNTMCQTFSGYDC